MYCTELELLHINICRNASTSIARGFKQTFPRYTFVNKHHAASDVCLPLPDGILNTYKSFTVVRNPYDRAVSMWLWHPKRWGLPFKGFLERVGNGWYARRGKRYSPVSDLGVHWPHVPQIDWISDPSGKIVVDKILRFEQLQDDMDMLCKEWQLPRVTIPTMNSSAERTGKRRFKWTFYYDAETANMVREYFRADFTAFGYPTAVHKAKK